MVGSEGGVVGSEGDVVGSGKMSVHRQADKDRAVQIWERKNALEVTHCALMRPLVGVSTGFQLHRQS